MGEKSGKTGSHLQKNKLLVYITEYCS